MSELLNKQPLGIAGYPHRTVKSFMRRQGYITPGQWQVLADCWPIYGLGRCNFQGVNSAVDLGQSQHDLCQMDFAKIFARQAPVVLEIGFGDGASLLSMACAAPELNFIGIEVYSRGVMQLIAAIDALKLNNIRILATDAVEVLQHNIPVGSLSAINLFFPDPWPKLRHNKRRLVQPEFVALAASKMLPNGKFYLATDWQDYAQQMLEVMSTAPDFINVYGNGQFAPRLEARIITKYEMKAKSAGHNIWDLCFQRQV